MHHKLSILYYLLLDVDDVNSHNHNHSYNQNDDEDGDNVDRAEDFSARAAVPQKYSIFMKGLWLMDSAEYGLALEFLTHPSLVPDFADDIVVALARHAARDGAHDYTLALAYYHAVQPILRTSLAQELLFDALARSASVSEALAFARARPVFVHQQLFRRLVLTVLDPARNSNGGGGDGNGDGDDTLDGSAAAAAATSPASARAFELASFPLDADEERWFLETLTSADAKRLRGDKDTLLMRRIARGEIGSAGEKGDWAVVLEGFKAGSGGRV